ncbi:YwiC-like family protein [Aquibacillus rhizosphaerae]|uniref:YwiC-like family protein n=1 Tax=Aquibacillus rhizosphaerae TaxID=3051431 RepID=A0ABT7LAL6_9BACI|nr:YwiC-like family protein [Aquibacillus sp. LR5S19]MDL4842908.1 YwiC-like family protein [Aquibacillus sp. LR5S19]
MKLFLPKQHGAWAMLIVPFGLGIVSGGMDWLQIPLGVAWIALYLSTYPLLLAVKKKKIKFHLKWSAIYFIIALIFITPVMLKEPVIIIVGLLMTPFFFLNLYFSRKKKDRLFLNDLSAIIAFSLSGLATYYLGTNQWNATAWVVASVCILFFVGSTFFIKTLIREKKNPAYRWISWTYHSILCLALIIIGNGLMALAFIPSLIRSIYFPGKTLKPMNMGIIEIVNSAIFFIVMSIYFY